MSAYIPSMDLGFRAYIRDFERRPFLRQRTLLWPANGPAAVHLRWLGCCGVQRQMLASAVPFRSHLEVSLPIQGCPSCEHGPWQYHALIRLLLAHSLYE